MNETDAASPLPNPTAPTPPARMSEERLREIREKVDRLRVLIDSGLELSENNAMLVDVFAELDATRRERADLSEELRGMVTLHDELDKDNERLTQENERLTRERDAAREVVDGAKTEIGLGDCVICGTVGCRDPHTDTPAPLSRLLTTVDREWPAIAALADAHWRTDSAQYFTSHHASVVDHLSARFAEIRAECGRPEVDVTDAERERIGHRVMLAIRDSHRGVYNRDYTEQCIDATLAALAELRSAEGAR